MSLNERLEFLVHLNADGAIKGFKALGDEAENNLKKGQTGLDKTGATMTKVGAGMVAGAAVIGVGLFELSKKWEETALAAGKLSAATGLTAEAASQWMVVAKGADVDTATLTLSLGKMDKAVQATPDKFNQLGAAIVHTKDGAVDVSATFLNVVDALNAHGGAAANAATATALLGKGWQGMAEILKQSSGSLKASLEAVSSAQVFHESDITDAERFRDTMKDLGNSAQGLAISLGKSAAPVIADVTTGLTGMVKGLSSANDATGGLVGKFAAFGTLGVGAAGSLTLIAGQAIKMRDKLTSVGEDGTRSLTGLGGAAVGVGVAVAAFGIITEVMGAKAREAKVNVDDLGKRMEALGLTAEEAARGKVAEFVSTHVELAAAMQTAGLKVDDLQAAIIGGSGAMDGFTNKMGASKDITDATLFSITKEIDALRSQATAYGMVTTQTKTTEAATASLGLTQAQVDAGVKAGIQAQLVANRELVASEKGVVQEYRDQLKAQQDITNAARAAVDAKYAFREAEQAAKEAIERTTAVLADQTTTENDATDAINTARDSAVNAAHAYATMKGDVEGSKQSINDQISSLQKQASTLAPDSLVRVAIAGYIADLQSIPTETSTQIKADTSQAITDLSTWRQNEEKIPVGLTAHLDNIVIDGETHAAGSTTVSGIHAAPSSASSIGTGSTRRAAGGPVSAGGMYQVLEGGKSELLTQDGNTYLMSGADGQVTPIGAGGGGATGGATYNLHVHVNINPSGPIIDKRGLVNLMVDGVVDGMRRGEIPANWAAA